MMILQFFTAIRNHESVEELERMRSTIGYEWETNSESYSLAETMRYAVLSGHAQYVVYIMQNYGDQLICADVCCPFLLLAVRLNQYDIVQTICNYSGKNAKEVNVDYINAKGCESMERGKTALHTACELGLLDCLKVLLQHGADQMSIDCDGITPLDRVLGAEFCSYDMFKCAVELARHREQLQLNTIARLNVLHERFHDRSVGEDGEQCKMCGFLPTNIQPSDLRHLSMHAIRHSLGISLPYNVKKLPIPNMIKDSISFQVEEHAGAVCNVKCC